MAYITKIRSLHGYERHVEIIDFETRKLYMLLIHRHHSYQNSQKGKIKSTVTMVTNW